MLGFGPISQTPLSSQIIWALFVLSYSELELDESVTSIRAATMPFITRASDTPPNQPFDGTLEGDIRIDRSITGGSGGYGGFAESISEISLINSSAIYDELASSVSVNGQDVRMSVGEVTGRDTVEPYAAFAVFANMKAERMTISRQHVVIELRDPSLVLSEETVQQTVYGGGGGADGDLEIAGKRVPFGDGVVFNATPTLVIGADAVWQFNNGAVTSIQGVKDGGVYLTFSADFATLSLLLAATISPGYYSTCTALGYFRLGGTSFKAITVDFTGLRLTTSDIIENVALTSASLSASQLDSASFDDLNVDQPATVGYYLDSNSSESCAEMFTKLMHGIGGWHGMTPLGQLQLKLFVEPDAVIVSGSYDTNAGDLLDIDRTALPTDVDPPPHRRRVMYARNWTVMTDLFGIVSELDPARAEYLKTPSKLTFTSEDAGAAIRADYPQAPDPDPVEAFFAYEVHAQAEADRLLELYSSGFFAYRAVIKNALFLHQPGQVILVTDDRLGLDDGKYLRLVSTIDDTSAGSTEVIGFG
jgi:hypothetical protein